MMAARSMSIPALRGGADRSASSAAENGTKPGRLCDSMLPEMIQVLRCFDLATAGKKTREIWPSEMNAEARQSFSRYSNLSVLVSGLTTLTTALAFRTAQNETTHSTVLSA